MLLSCTMGSLLLVQLHKESQMRFSASAKESVNVIAEIMTTDMSYTMTEESDGFVITDTIKLVTDENHIYGIMEVTTVDMSKYIDDIQLELVEIYDEAVGTYDYVDGVFCFCFFEDGVYSIYMIMGANAATIEEMESWDILSVQHEGETADDTDWLVQSEDGQLLLDATCQLLKEQGYKKN